MKGIPENIVKWTTWEKFQFAYIERELRKEGKLKESQKLNVVQKIQIAMKLGWRT